MTNNICEITYDDIEKGKRVRSVITLSEKFKKCLKELYKDLDIYDYSFSYFIEDILLWVVMDEERYEKFVNDTYEEYPPANTLTLEEAVSHAKKD